VTQLREALLHAKEARTLRGAKLPLHAKEARTLWGVKLPLHASEGAVCEYAVVEQELDNP
jgi:hypothetical protein